MPREIPEERGDGMPVFGQDELPRLGEYHEALSMVRCPYYQRGGTCESGCHNEPRCMTDAPREGWESVIRRFRDA